MTSSYALIGEVSSTNYLGYSFAMLTCIQFTAFALARGNFPRGACDVSLLLGTEFVKLICATLGCQITGEYPSNVKDWLDVLPVVFSFVIMNVISMWCTTLVPPSLFVTIMQLKLVFTALMSKTCTGRVLSTPRWFALMFVMLGVVGSSQRMMLSASDHENTLLFVAGILGLLFETFLSGVSAVYMQTLLETGPWPRNFQLASISTVVYIVALRLDPRCRHRLEYTSYDCILVVLGATGGILVAMTLRYAGAVEKTIATSASIVLTSAFEVLTTGSVLSPAHICASLTVVLAAVMYAVL